MMAIWITGKTNIYCISLSYSAVREVSVDESQKTYSVLFVYYYVVQQYCVSDKYTVKHKMH